ncbi:glycine/betaine ABC transporter permease [Leifsonia xyli subsp. xyli]|uniref:ABC-type glycine betaine transport, permease protein n=2 Tax=Leifsonia xyli subsp. xyli TaxID=59736 RepID=G1UBE2_LEIXX|nr:ABC transporter permease [Leifsonia xyli]AAP55492.1 PROZ-like protein [Leifsonia xyli subsp. xyli]AAT89073.1 ABC-type glycine betaine transport, permease protein [Leifsonia xyli subsp. xyli str. CTCB07]ODA90745.1 glycine/betaine ABC transporter permease [Leifsonia xyli subsp. xyli]
MTDFIAAFGWLFDPANTAGPRGIPTRAGEHILYSLLTLLLSGAIALPIGFLIGHTGRLRGVAVGFSGALRALPTLGLVVYLALLTANISIVPPLIALTVLAIPPLLAGAYSGLQAVDRRTIDAARAVGMTEWQIFSKVELPLSLPLVLGGIRAGALQVIATWTVAAILPVGGLGRFLFDGLAVQNYPEMLGGSIIVVALALVVDGLFALTQRIVVPRGVAAGKARTDRGKDPARAFGIVAARRQQTP